MKLAAIYKCLGDETRLRMLSLLFESPLCVCHIQKVLGKSQVIASQHLALLRAHGMVSCRRYRNWMIYSLPPSPPPELEIHLNCLQDCVSSGFIFKNDRAKLKKLMGTRGVRTLLNEGCCARYQGKSPPDRTAVKSGRKSS